MSAIPVEKRAILVENAAKIVAPGKGILAADERSFSFFLSFSSNPSTFLFSLSLSFCSTGTIGKRFTPIGVENSEENRRQYRELLFTAPGIEQYIGGVIFYEETLYQKTSEGKLFTDLISERGILPGIKIDLVSIRFFPFKITFFIQTQGCLCTFLSATNFMALVGPHKDLKEKSGRVWCGWNSVRRGRKRKKRRCKTKSNKEISFSESISVMTRALDLLCGYEEK